MKLVTVALSSIFLLMLSGDAYAYIDAGTGSMILQIVLGGVAGALVILKLYWHRFKDFFASKRAGSDQGE